MAMTINPVNLARAIVTAHKRWLAESESEDFSDKLLSCLAKVGRKDLNQVRQTLRSVQGQMTARASRTANFVADCNAAVKAEEAELVRRALECLAE